MKSIILLIPSAIKVDIIQKAREKYYNYDIKFMSLIDFRNKITFLYDKKTIYYLMKEYHLKYSTAILYLENLYYLSDKLDNPKMERLKEIKDFLIKNNLLTTDSHFVSFAKKSKIYVYGYDDIDKYYLNILKDFTYEIIPFPYQDYHHNLFNIYYASDIQKEVIFVANEICKLVKQNIEVSKIKIIAPKEYDEITARIFKMYNLPLEDKKVSIYSSPIVKKILNNLNSAEDIIKEIKDENLAKRIISILNEYSFLHDREEARSLIEEDMQRTYLKEKTISIQKITLNDIIKEDDYVFILGFNKEHFPKLYYDNDYFSDKEKDILGLSTSTLLSEEERKSELKKLNNIKNLTITYKLYDATSTYARSNLLPENNDILIKNNDYTHSNMINKVLLAEKLDNLIKYNIKEDDIELLSSFYHLPYLKYDNTYHKIDRDNLYKYLNNKLTLSYTHLDNYNRCAFRYYMENILKLNIIQNDFPIIIGNICHEVLSNIDKEDFTIDKYFALSKAKARPLSAKEEFFLSKVKEELSFIVSTIKKQLTYTSFDKKMYEHKVYIDYDKDIKVTFMGVLDKVMYLEDDTKTYLVVIDYKTGNTSIKLENIKYGIDMQLPIYLYLSSNMQIKNVYIAGFYLQKLLTTTLDNTKDYETAREDTLKLEGYSTANENILSLFDKTYASSKLIKSLKMTQNGFSYYSKVLDDDSIAKIKEDVKKIINDTIDNILDANFNINPKIINGENVSCKYCPYNDICYRREKDFTYINEESNHE